MGTAPTRQHELAIKGICRYLFKGKDKCLILKPDNNKGLECHVDADWAGLWSQISSDDLLSPCSRIAFFISYAGCPI